MTRLSERQKRSIEYNKKHGLLCACNKVLVPYYDRTGKEHGTLTVGGVRHGYDDCVPEKER